MRNEATVNKAEIAQIKDLMMTAVGRLNVILTSFGCVHSNAIEVTTMGGGNTTKHLCPDCGETIEEEIIHDFQL